MANLKIYKAKSEVHLCAVLGEGKNMHVSFEPLTGGGSIFRTKDKELQDALERHYQFGRLFRLLEEVKEKEPAKKPVKLVSKEVPDAGNEDTGLEPEDEEGGPETEEGAGSEDGMKVVPVACVPDAKEYLAETFGLSRTSLRSRVKIEAAAKENGIRFEFQEE